MAQYPVPEVKPPRDQVNPKPIPDHASELSSVPEEIKPIVDVVLRMIKHQTATIPAVNNAKKSVVKYSTIQTSPDHLIASPVSRESLNKSVSFSTEVHTRRNNNSENHKLADTVRSNSQKEQESKLQPNAALQPNDLTITGEIAGKHNFLSIQAPVFQPSTIIVSTKLMTSSSKDD